jgi:hypothetical protein
MRKSTSSRAGAAGRRVQLHSSEREPACAARLGRDAIVRELEDGIVDTDHLVTVSMLATYLEDSGSRTSRPSESSG